MCLTKEAEAPTNPALITGGSVLPLEASKAIFAPGAVLVVDGVIEAVGALGLGDVTGTIEVGKREAG